MSRDELAGRLKGVSSMVVLSSGSADDDRRLATEERRQARLDLSAAYRDDTTGAGRVALTDFVLERTARMTRSADCAECGATTLIQLALAVTPPPGNLAAPADG